ncbi:hypothetical protein SEVIR_3G015900v4 [Setaria viridis]|uniref:Dof zinc finger protein n=2 Tax=Setaria TaxID=4554 RepID=K3Z9N5_SETIT|nr:dof zinc finger protein 2 [Setaria italica]XP_034586680.1 dof zinc finger protein 2-like [Setaria viridis]RCV14893.1 hypothetical protein SETIT_3G014900v2 [Setaria italica]TKW23879.1 hypothetical protein SEVIR_3G015900v2 [Setaria viridis]
MAPAASILSATSAAAASKRPPASDAEPLLQGDGEAARKGQQPSRQQQLECPRCQSTNTKFCYYNNYSTAQPRHFCRACRRYWTHGGTLRDVPVGGASRRTGGSKRRRVSAEPSPSASASSPPQTTAGADAFLLAPDLSAFPFLSDGSFLMPPQLDLGVAPAAFSSWQSVVPDFYDGLAPWDDGATGMTGPWGDIAGGLEPSWPPPGN